MPKIFVSRRPPESAVALLREAFGAENVTIIPRTDLSRAKTCWKSG